MDFLPDKEFNSCFNRISARVDFRGAGTVEEINARLKQVIRGIKGSFGKSPLAELQEELKITPWRTLISSGFAKRVIDEALADPHGQVALTLKYGRERARAILSTRARRRLRW